MIRIIVRGHYLDYDGNGDFDMKTFDIENKELEEYLTQSVGYSGAGSRSVIGAEILKSTKQRSEPMNCTAYEEKRGNIRR